MSHVEESEICVLCSAQTSYMTFCDMCTQPLCVECAESEDGCYSCQRKLCVRCTIFARCKVCKIKGFCGLCCDGCATCRSFVCARCATVNACTGCDETMCNKCGTSCDVCSVSL